MMNCQKVSTIGAQKRVGATIVPTVIEPNVKFVEQKRDEWKKRKIGTPKFDSNGE